MVIGKVEFAELEKEISKTGKPVLDFLAPKVGKAYVIAITRDGCSACEKQKPKLGRLASTLRQEHGNNVVFTRIHIKYAPRSEEESKRSKSVLGHYFYPTNLILFRTPDRGTIEYYKNSSPTMNELKKNIEIAMEIATMIGREKP
jgi:hypothetical protein